MGGSKYLAGEVLHVEPVRAPFNPPGAQNPSGNGTYLFGQPRDTMKSLPPRDTPSQGMWTISHLLCARPHRTPRTVAEGPGTPAGFAARLFSVLF